MCISENTNFVLKMPKAHIWVKVWRQLISYYSWGAMCLRINVMLMAYYALINFLHLVFYLWFSPFCQLFLPFFKILLTLSYIGQEVSFNAQFLPLCHKSPKKIQRISREEIVIKQDLNTLSWKWSLDDTKVM